MSKSLFEDELMAGMETQLRKQAAAEKPSLVKAAECLHAALEIFEEQGMTARADQVLKLLQKLAQSNEARDVMKMPTPKALMEAGLTQRDMHEFAKGSPIAKAKFNLVLRSMGFSDHNIGQIIGPTNVMSEDEAKELIDPNRSFSTIWDFVKNPTAPFGEKLPPRNTDKIIEPGDAFEFKSTVASQKKRSDRHTKGLTPEKMVKNLEDHGHPMNLANDCAVEIPPPFSKSSLKDSDMEPDFMELLQSPSFDIDASDDELFGMEIKEDSLEVSENDLSMGEMDDFEDERD